VPYLKIDKAALQGFEIGRAGSSDSCSVQSFPLPFYGPLTANPGTTSSKHPKEAEMISRGLRRSLIPALCLLGLAAIAGFGQSTSGSITGTVKDSTGSPIADASVNITNATNNLHATDAEQQLRRFHCDTAASW
jgi:hypothetical protein